jgi:hypothetical protein
MMRRRGHYQVQWIYQAYASGEWTRFAMATVVKILNAADVPIKPTVQHYR